MEEVTVLGYAGEGGGEKGGGGGTSGGDGDGALVVEMEAEARMFYEYLLQENEVVVGEQVRVNMRVWVNVSVRKDMRTRKDVRTREEVNVKQILKEVRVNLMQTPADALMAVRIVYTLLGLNKVHSVFGICCY